MKNIVLDLEKHLETYLTPRRSLATISKNQNFDAHEGIFSIFGTTFKQDFSRKWKKVESMQQKKSILKALRP